MGEKHGMARTPTYRSWIAMRTRCLNPKRPYFKNYGGRGITICESWNSFEAFFADMGTRPEGTSLDRIDNDGNYEPGNCRWATRAQQAANTRKTRVAVVNGEERSLQEIARAAGMSGARLYARVRLNPEMADAIAEMALVNPAEVPNRKKSFRSNKLNPAHFVGKRYGRLTVVEFHSHSPRGLRFSCDCQCGAKTVSHLSYLERGDTRSCGCFQREHAAALRRQEAQSRAGATL